MLDVNHIFIEGIESDLLECIEPRLIQLYGKSSNLKKNEIDRRFIEQQYICGERNYSHGIFNLKWNNWKEILGVILDLSYHLKGIDDEMSRIFRVCNQIHNEVFYREIWTDSNINDYISTATK